MFCKNCGKDINDSKFCPHCGAKASEEVIVATAVDDEEPKQPYYGEYGEIVMPDGRRVFNSAESATRASDEAVKSIKWIKYISMPLGMFLVLPIVISFFTLYKAENGWWWVPIVVLVPAILAIAILWIILSIINPINMVKRGKWLKEKNVDVRETLEKDTLSKKAVKKHLMCLKLVGGAPGWVVLNVLDNLTSGCMLISIYAFLGAFVELGHLMLGNFLIDENIIFCIFIAILVVFAIYYAACIIAMVIIRAIQNAVAKNRLENENQEEENASK